MYAVLTPNHEDRTENDWTNTWSVINFRLFLLSPKKSHARFMMSSLSRTKDFIAVNTRLFTGSSVKREWSFFLFWALNRRSQGTMPTGMIRVRIKCVQLDYVVAKGVSEASQIPRLDAWIICHSIIWSTTPWTKHDHWPWKSVIILWTIE